MCIWAKWGRFCHFPRALPGSICSSPSFYWHLGHTKRGVTMTLFMLFSQHRDSLGPPNTAKQGKNAKGQIDPVSPSHKGVVLIRGYSQIFHLEVFEVSAVPRSTPKYQNSYQGKRAYTTNRGTPPLSVCRPTRGHRAKKLWCIPFSVENKGKGFFTVGEGFHGGGVYFSSPL